VNLNKIITFTISKHDNTFKQKILAQFSTEELVMYVSLVKVQGLFEFCREAFSSRCNNDTSSEEWRQFKRDITLLHVEDNFRESVYKVIEGIENNVLKQTISTINSVTDWEASIVSFVLLTVLANVSSDAEITLTILANILYEFYSQETELGISDMQKRLARYTIKLYDNSTRKGLLKDDV